MQWSLVIIWFKHVFRKTYIVPMCENSDVVYFNTRKFKVNKN